MATRKRLKIDARDGAPYYGNARGIHLSENTRPIALEYFDACVWSSGDRLQMQAPPLPSAYKAISLRGSRGCPDLPPHDRDRKSTSRLHEGSRRSPEMETLPNA